MTFSYSGDPASSQLDAVRFYSQDTDETDFFLTNEEINYIADQWSNVSDSPIYLAAVVCDTISAKFARELSYSGDGVSVGGSELQQKYATLAENLREQYKASVIGGGPDVSGILIGEQYDPTIKPLTFAKGMHDNPEAGQQDFGGYNERRYRDIEGGY